VVSVRCPYLIVDTEHNGHGPVLRLRGELDVTGMELLENAISAAVQARPQTLAIDLSELAYMDCAGASVLGRTHDLLAAWPAQLLITGAQPAVQRLLDLLDARTGSLPRG
jgi:anti-anti-sigma factor